MIAFTVCAKKKIFKNLNSFIIEFLHLQSWIFSESITYLYIHRFIWLKLFITKISLTFRFHNDNVWFFFSKSHICCSITSFWHRAFFLLIQDVLKNENIKLDWDFKVSLLSDAVRVSTKNQFFAIICVCVSVWWLLGRTAGVSCSRCQPIYTCTVCPVIFAMI